MKTQKQIALINVASQLGAGRSARGYGWFDRQETIRSYLEGRGLVVADMATIQEPTEPAMGDPAQRYLPGTLNVLRRVKARVADSLNRGLMPVVIGGDHSLAIATVSASAEVLQQQCSQPLGLIWVGAHIDYNTPATSPSGNTHGMSLQALLQSGPGSSFAEITGSSPVVSPRDAAVVGFRFADVTEIPNIGPDGPTIFSMRDIDQMGISAVNRELVSRIAAHTGGIHLSLDLDALDPSVAPAVNTPAPGGMTFREMRMVCDMAATTGRLLTLDVVEHNPEKGQDEIMMPLIAELISCALGASAMPEIRQTRLD